MLRALMIATLGVVAQTAGGGGSSPCSADLTFDGAVNGLDLATLLGQWGACPVRGDCPGDLDASGAVNGLDLAMLLAAWGAACSPLSTNLAGNPLSQYPYFEYVTAFNQGAGFHVAIDPTRFPQLVGKSCDLYIVAHKTQEQWAADPALIDLTGGAQAVNIGGATVQASTFAVSGSTDLSGTQGTAIGIGYEAILDCNRNGQLDSADVIDGLQPINEAGLYVVRDTAAPGPYTVTQQQYFLPQWSGVAGMEEQILHYPDGIGELGVVPVVVFSPGGNGQTFTAGAWNHLGEFLASYGYIVMQHRNLTAPGVFAASETTLLHIDGLIAQQDVIAGGAIDGHIDQDSIVLIGHSRGAEGQVVAYDRLIEGTYTPIGWSAASIKLISGMAPTHLAVAADNDPHDVNYHLWVAAADTDTTGCPSSAGTQVYRVHDRASGRRMATTLHGVGHGDFHTQFSSEASGPCLIGKGRTIQIVHGYLLPLIKHTLEGDVASRDFLTRQWESFKPIGAPQASRCPSPDGTGFDVVVDLMYRDAAGFMIDDFQSNPVVGMSSSGGFVTTDVTNLVEDRADDLNTNFTWMPNDPMNGMTLATSADSSRVAVFEWNAPAFLEFAIIDSGQDLSDGAYLSFRAAQGSRHPNTVAALEDLTFDVVLRDAAGVTSRISIGAYGGGIEEPYQRNTGPACGTGLGWANEFETIRIRLTDFLTNGSALDLTNIVAVRFEFAAPGSGTSPAGRLGLDEIAITAN